MILKKNSYHKLNGKTLKHVFFQRHGFGKNIEGETGTSGKEHPSSRLKDARCCHQLVTKASFSVALRLEVCPLCLCGPLTIWSILRMMICGFRLARARPSLAAGGLSVVCARAVPSRGKPYLRSILRSAHGKVWARLAGHVCRSCRAWRGMPSTCFLATWCISTLIGTHRCAATWPWQCC